MRHRAGVLGELAIAQVAHFLDANHRARVLVAAVFLVAVDREPFLERELEPVAAGDAVAGPVVEVLVRHDLVDAEVVVVGGAVGAREDVLRVEDIESLVLHRAGVEVGDRDDHEALQVELEAEHVLVPAHAFLERLHGEAGLVELAGLHVELQQRLLARARREVVLEQFEVRGDHREEIAGLGEGVLPPRPVPLTRGRGRASREPARGLAFARGEQVAVGEQARELRLVGAERDAVRGHHVGAVDEVGDAPESLRLALRDEPALGGVQALELCVLPRVEAHHRLEREAVGHLRDREMAFVGAILARSELASVDRCRHQLEILAVEDQRLLGAAACGIARDLERGVHDRLRGLDVHVERDRRDEERRRRVVLQVDDLGGGVAHREVERPALESRASLPGYRWILLQGARHGPPAGLRQITQLSCGIGRGRPVPGACAATRGRRPAAAPSPSPARARRAC